MKIKDLVYVMPSTQRVLLVTGINDDYLSRTYAQNIYDAYEECEIKKIITKLDVSTNLIYLQVTI
jgi:hypothetical protein